MDIRDVKNDVSGSTIYPVTSADAIVFSDGQTLIEKISSLIEKTDEMYEKATEVFWIENISDSPCTVTLNKNGSPNIISLNYSYDQSNWTTFTTDGTGSFSIPAKSKAYVKGDNSIFSSSSSSYYTFSFDQQCNIGGNLMSLVRGSETLTGGMFIGLFMNNINIIDASQLLLPATTLAGACYSGMFMNCTSLITAPALPATILASSCYEGMFWGCTSLTTAPNILPATTLDVTCYYGMFADCTSLITAPNILPATNLATLCYCGMFAGCISLTTAPILPATTLANDCYIDMFNGCTNLNYIKAMFTTTPSSSYTNNWLSGVASSGTFVKNAAATWDVTGDSGIPSGWTVISESA